MDEEFINRCLLLARKGMGRVAPNPMVGALVVYQGVIIAGFGFLSNAWLVKRYLPSTVTFFSFIQPPAGLVLAWLTLGEDPGSGLIAGLFFIVVGAIIFGGESYLRARKVASLKSDI